MRGLMKAFAVIAVLGALAYVGYTWIFTSGTLRYRLTIEVMIDGEVRSGSSVIEVTYTIQPTGLSPTRVVPEVRGEAVVVDLGAPGLLVVLLWGGPPGLAQGHSGNASTMPVKEFGLAGSIGALSEATVRHLSSLDARADLSPEHLPMFVWFRDPRNPASATQVDAAHLAAAFGPGAHFVRATMETTRDRVTAGIEKQLPWLTDYDKTTEAVRAFTNNLAGWPSIEPTTLFRSGPA